MLGAIGQHAAPVVIVGIPSQQGDRVMLIEQRRNDQATSAAALNEAWVIHASWARSA